MTAAATRHHRTHSTSTTWRIDSAASWVEFVAEKRLFHLKRVTVRGRFGAIRGTIRLDEQPANSSADLVIDLTDVDTGNGRRDAHLRSADYFDVTTHPLATFASRAVAPVGVTDWRYRVEGDLTIRGVTRPVTLDVEYTPPQPDARERIARFVATAVLNRRDFGLDRSHPVAPIADEIRVAVIVEATPGRVHDDAAPDTGDGVFPAIGRNV